MHLAGSAENFFHRILLVAVKSFLSPLLRQCSQKRTHSCILFLKNNSVNKPSEKRLLGKFTILLLQRKYLHICKKNKIFQKWPILISTSFHSFTFVSGQLMFFNAQVVKKIFTAKKADLKKVHRICFS